MKNTQNQSGFTLLELSITTVIAGMMILAMVQMQTYQAQLEKARAIAQTYQKLNNAVGTYMVNHYTAILNVRGGGARAQECSRPPARGAGAPFQALPTDCGGNIPIAGAVGRVGQTVPVANLRQPTLQELRRAGYLDASQELANNTLPLPTFFTNPAHPNHMLNANNQAANPGFAVLIDTPNLANPRDMRSLVFNLQPFNLARNSLGGESLLDQVLLSAGSDGLLSGGDAAGELRPQDAGAANAAIPNPLRIAGNVGAPSVFAMLNGFGSSGWDQYVRRDGTTPLTADWNVGGQSIIGINNVGATTVTATGQITGGSGVFGVWDNTVGQIQAALKATTAYIRDTLTVGAQLVVEGNTQLDGNLNVENATTLNTLTATGATKLADLTAGATGVTTLTAGATGVTTLTASGDTTLAALRANGNTSVGNFALRNSFSIGEACDSAIQTIAKNSQSEEGQRYNLLYCLNNKWQPAVNLAGIETSITTINENITNIGGNITTIGENITTINENLTYLKNQELKWELINVTWRPAQFERVEGGRTILRAQNKVWRRTPWLCNDLSENAGNGGMPVWSGGDGIRYETNASDRQKSTTFTPPMVLSIDGKPRRDNYTWDVNCGTPNQTNNHNNADSVNSYWYVGFSSVENNIRNGNACRQGLGSTLTLRSDTMETYGPRNPVYNSADCQNFNIYAPSFNTGELMAVRFVAFTKPNKDKTPKPAGW
jgi:prepilin-type N-terminal cleavage/methylation domain-containing protein